MEGLEYFNGNLLVIKKWDARVTGEKHVFQHASLGSIEKDQRTNLITQYVQNSSQI